MTDQPVWKGPGKRTRFKGPGQWRSQADAAQQASPRYRGDDTSAPARRMQWDDSEAARADWNPDLHPRDRKGEFAAKPGGGVKLAGPAPASAGGLDSLTEYTRPDGSLAPARQQLHDRIVAEALAGHQRQARPVAVFLGGGTAAGKSTIMAGGQGDTVMIDADRIKAKLPDYQQRLKNADPSAAAYVHEESSALAKRIQAESVSNRYNFTLDGTGDSTTAKMAGKIEQARAAGYHVDGRYVTVDTAEAVRRAQARAAETGRMVPEPVIREIHAAVSDVFSQLVARDVFDSVELWDTNSRPPVLVGVKPPGGTWQVKDPGAWQRFLAKKTGG